jgi:site-specific DNA-methyltransferase (adenine-specific)
MGKKWDNTGNFYSWCNKRAEELFRVIKPGGYVLIFGHPKTNHRMKCAFEDVGFNVVEEIDWIYLTGMPKNQDIGKLFDKRAGKERKVIGVAGKSAVHEGGYKSDAVNNSGGKFGGEFYNTIPTTELAKEWNGWKTSGLKPSHEPITVFQKPLEGTYCDNIEKWNCGGMNIDACRVPINPEIDDPRLGGKGDWSTTKAAENIYEGGYAGERVSSSELGRFPSNVIFDEYAKDMLDEQTGIRTSGSNCVRRKEGTFVEHGGLGKAGDVQITSSFTSNPSSSRDFNKISAISLS